MKVDAVFEGGGVRGIAIAGAVSWLEKQGYTWERLAGTSAGSIVAALLAAGYTGLEIEEILTRLDYRQFQDKTRLQSIPYVGAPLGLILQKAIHEGQFLETWIADLLHRKGVDTFADLTDEAGFRLKIIASDITGRRLLVLPDDLVHYGLEPERFSVAKAVRMSSSIPFYFKPVQLQYQGKRTFIVDGGILSNFPVWLFDTQGAPRWPTFGFQLVSPEQSRTA